MSESTQHWLDRNRPPRVQITYDVETGGALVKKELPLVVGILADLGAPAPAAGDASEEEKARVAAARPEALKDRQFVQIDRDNFDEILAKLNPSVHLSGVKNQIQDGETGDLSLDLAFSSMDDFGPMQVLKQMLSGNDALRDLFYARQQLSELLARLDGQDGLKQAIANAIDVDPTTLPAATPATA